MAGQYDDMFNEGFEYSIRIALTGKDTLGCSSTMYLWILILQHFISSVFGLQISANCGLTMIL